MNTQNWSELLQRAVTEPGAISSAYSTFHEYSMGNAMLAMFQCAARDIPLGPIGTFMHWKALGRNVRKGERAIQLCMPVTGKRTDKNAETGEETEHGYTRFVFRNNWFVLAQTDGAEYVPAPIPEWDETRALCALNVEKVAFAETNGNVQGYALHRTVAVSPVAALPYKTLFHELGHVVLGHTSEGQLSDGEERTARDIRELEAESVAMLCCESLGLAGAEFSRGYIQSWFHGAEVPERSAQRIFKAADEILKAGRPV